MKGRHIYMDGVFLGNPRDFGAEIVAFDEERMKSGE